IPPRCSPATSNLRPNPVRQACCISAEQCRVAAIDGSALYELVVGTAGVICDPRAQIVGVTTHYCRRNGLVDAAAARECVSYAVRKGFERGAAWYLFATSLCKGGN